MFFERFKMFEKINQQNDWWHCRKIENKWIYIFKVFTEHELTFMHFLSY
jgi:hypothetical protein